MALFDRFRKKPKEPIELPSIKWTCVACRQGNWQHWEVCIGCSMSRKQNEHIIAQRKAAAKSP